MSTEISCKTFNKQQNRRIIKNFVKANMSKKKIRTTKVLCLPGWEGLEIDAWREIGINTKNIYGITNDINEYNYLRKNKRGAKIIYGDLFDRHLIKKITYDICMRKNHDNSYLIEKYENICKNNKAILLSMFNPNNNDLFLEENLYNILRYFDIVYFDFYGNKWINNPSPILDYMSLVKDGGIFGITWSLSREKGNRTRISTFLRRQNKINAFVCQILGYASNHLALLSREFYVNAIINAYSAKNKLLLGNTGYIMDWEKAIDIFIKNSSVSKWGKENIFNTIYRNGIYPTDSLKTCYLGGKKATTPMGTILFKFKKLSRINFQRRPSIVNERIKQYSTSPIINISKTSVINIKKKNNNKKLQPNKAEIIELFKTIPLLKSKEVAEAYGIPIQQAAAYKAHVTMGTY